MTLGNPYRAGGALAITVAIGYALCTIAFWLFPDASANFMNALFHGLDFSPLKRDGTFTFASFVYAFTVLVVWAFLMGAGLRLDRGTPARPRRSCRCRETPPNPLRGSHRTSA